MAKGKDIVIGRRGDSLMGTVKTKAFTIKSAFGPIKIPTKSIAWIHFKNPGQFKEDEVWISAGDRLTGRVSPAIIEFQVTRGQTLKIHRDDIHTLMLHAHFSARARGLPGS